MVGAAQEDIWRRGQGSSIHGWHNLPQFSAQLVLIITASSNCQDIQPILLLGIVLPTMSAWASHTFSKLWIGLEHGGVPSDPVLNARDHMVQGEAAIDAAGM